MKGKTCCVTGHRDLPQNEINKIKAALEHEIDAAVTDPLHPPDEEGTAGNPGWRDRPAGLLETKNKIDTC